MGIIQIIFKSIFKTKPLWVFLVEKYPVEHLFMSIRNFVVLRL